jgi:phosphatidylglycerol:prolipoprotein diacylglycerol transferase
MYPILIEIGPVTIYWYGAMMALAFLSAVLNCMYLGRKKGRSSAVVSDLIFWMALAGLVGARVAYVVANLEEYAQQPITALYLHEGGLIFYGGVIGGVIGILAFARVKQENTLFLLDIVAVAAPLGHAIGRMGCFLNGCCHGAKYSGKLAVPFAGDGQLVHPVQLYEVGSNLILYLALLWFFSRSNRDAVVAATYLMAYSVIRFVVEFFRGDPRLMIAGLTAAQVTSVILLLVGVSGLIWAQTRGRQQTGSDN